ncbi:MAG: sensor histidine kinase [Lewinellaceae bacterium]|nr:sensor histidine kinase [Lewinellaceae bacterium]
MLSFFAYTLLAYLALKAWYPVRSLVDGVCLTLSMPSILLVGVALRYLIQEVISFKIFGFGNYPEDYGLQNYFFDNSYYGLMYSALGIVAYFSHYARYKEQKQLELLLQQKQTELAFLRAHINPHFLFNSLNNIYALIHDGSGESLKAVEKLSGLLRYALYEKTEKVPLKKELEAIRDFISLERLRYSTEPEIRWKTDACLEDRQIAPLLLIPLIENAFKHGDVRSPIIIGLYKQGDWLCFSVENACVAKAKHAQGGIGLQNIKKRLELLYARHQVLEVRNAAGHFHVLLKIKLDAC